jgi:hypothetical protein
MCDKVDMGNGDFAIICGGRHKRQPPCITCGHPSSKLCDFPVVVNGKPRTCDKPICSRCAVSKGPDVDWCQPHERNSAGIFAQREREGLRPDGMPRGLFDEQEEPRGISI